MTSPRPSTGSRTLALMPPLVAVLTLVAASVLVDIMVVRWPLRMGDVQWRYQTFNLVLSAGPQLSLVLAIIAIVGVIGGFRAAVSWAGIAAAIVGILLLLLTPLFLLDVLQLRRQVPIDSKLTFGLVAMKTAGFSILFAVVDLWTAQRAVSLARRSKEDGERGALGRGVLVAQD
jgi:hypothetical protein